MQRGAADIIPGDSAENALWSMLACQADLHHCCIGPLHSWTYSDWLAQYWVVYCPVEQNHILATAGVAAHVLSAALCIGLCPRTSRKRMLSTPPPPPPPPPCYPAVQAACNAGTMSSEQQQNEAGDFLGPPGAITQNFAMISPHDHGGPQEGPVMGHQPWQPGSPSGCVAKRAEAR